MRAGRLDRELTILAKTTAKNDAQETVETYAPLPDNQFPIVPCEMKPVRGSEQFVSEQFLNQVEKLFTIRWRADISENNRIRFEGKDYIILEVQEPKRREFQQLNCTTSTKTEVPA